MEILEDDLIRLRRLLHQQPEVGFEVDATRQAIIKWLKPRITAHFQLLTHQGLWVELEGASQLPLLVFRAELDGLPILEDNPKLPYQSNIEGYGHLCGHDGHMAILCALATKWNAISQAEKKCRIALLFQPAEETGEGARALLSDAWLRDQPVQHVFALHNIPGLTLGSVHIKAGAFTCAVESCIIQFSGSTAHAAEPERGNSPTEALATALAWLPSIQHNDLSDPDFFLAVPTYANMGLQNAHGTMAGHARLHITCRAQTGKRLSMGVQQLSSYLDKLAQQYKLGFHFDTLEYFHATDNAADSVQLLKQGAEAVQLDLVHKGLPYRWGEDFGRFTAHWKGAMCGLGAGESCPPLHASNYDFPDSLIAVGSQLFLETALHFQAK